VQNLLERIAKHLASALRPEARPRRARTYECRCGRTVFFRNSLCLACHAPLGYEPESGELYPLSPATNAGTWRLDASDGSDGELAYRRCHNFDLAPGCNWLVPESDDTPYCRACRLNRTIPDQSDPDNQRYWRAIENAKRRMVAELISLGLPVRSHAEDPEHGLTFDLLRSPPEGPRVMTGHVGGLITLNVEEADDVKREAMRHGLHEPYRTLLGHFRHEMGHYYWDLLVSGTRWHEPFRELFGDERADYAAAIEANYRIGPPVDWPQRYISAYASSHPWEDWAETWAHYLHVHDSLDTAMGFGFLGEHLSTEIEGYTEADLYDPSDPDRERVLRLFNTWLGLTAALNEMARSMGQPDLYPFVTSRSVVRKLHFIHLVARGARSPEVAQALAAPAVA
jgi:hypothetical protein